MMILLDTNVILRSKQPNSTHYTEVTKRLIDFAQNGDRLLICPQVIYEFYAVATRPPEKNGFGYSNSEADVEVENILNTFAFIDDSDSIFDTWRTLVTKYEVKGKPTHDTRLIAFMQTNKIKKLYTINKKDFQRYQGIIELV